jgi:DNA-binding HxlR family transcriptional regulator
MTKLIPNDGPCPVERVLHVFGAKWKPSILFHLETEGTLRFNELRRQVYGITQRMLTNQLRELERDGLVEREHFPEIPPRVEYSLTQLGRTVGPVGQVIDQWGQKHMQKVYKARQQYDKRER